MSPLRRPLFAALLGALALGPALARAARPVVPSGQKPPPEPEPAKPAEPAKPPEAKPEPVGAKPAEKKPEPARIPEAKPPEPKKIENPAEVIYRQKVGEHVFRLRVRPGAPKPGDALELVLEAAELRDPPDPVLGDRAPIENEELVASFAPKGKSAPQRLLHPQAAGEYALHVTAEEAGLHELVVGRRTGKPGLDVTFPLGVGVPTPGRPDDVVAAASGSAHGPVRAGPAAGGDAAQAGKLAATMKEMGAQLLLLQNRLGEGKGDFAAQTKALAELGGQVPGTVPAAHADRKQEYEAQAQANAAALSDLAKLTDREKAKAKLTEIEQAQCLRCHAQFWWGVADDTSAWPTFTPGNPQASTP